MMRKKFLFSIISTYLCNFFIVLSAVNIPDTSQADQYLFMACTKGCNGKKVSFFIEQGANVNAKREHGATPLHVACKFGHLHIIKILIQNNAEVNASTRELVTPLHCAVMAKNISLSAKVLLIRFLLDSGADSDIKTSTGHSALDLAHHLEEPCIIELFANQSHEISNDQKEF
jgi:ankyrin repeat protein